MPILSHTTGLHFVMMALDYHRRTGSADDGSGSAVSHRFRVENGRLRNVHALTHLPKADFRDGGGQERKRDET